MGQVLIEIPQNVFASYHVDDPEFGEQLLDDLEPYSKSDRIDTIPPPRNDRKQALKEVFGIWADRDESAQEIARKIRENNRKVT